MKLTKAEIARLRKLARQCGHWPIARHMEKKGYTLLQAWRVLVMGK